MLKFLQTLALDFSFIFVCTFLIPGLSYRQMYRKFKNVVLGLLAHGFSRILRSEALVYNSYFFRTAILQQLFDIRFSHKHGNFSRVCLLVKMASKTVTSFININGNFI